MQTIDKEKIALNAGEARMVLDHPILNEAFDKVKDGLVQAIEDLEFGTKDGDILRDKLMLSLQSLKQVKEDIYSHIEEHYIQQINPEDL